MYMLYVTQDANAAPFKAPQCSNAIYNSSLGHVIWFGVNKQM